MTDEIQKNKIKLQSEKSAPDASSHAVEPTAKTTPPKIGPDFEVLDWIGQGGMGSVFKVKNRKTNSLMAIKLLKNDLTADATALKRFEQEAKSLAELDHPNLVAMYGHGHAENGAPYLVMDYLDGNSLAELLQLVGKVDETRAIPIFIQICEGLSHAHEKGIVHRDIKPSNIIICKGQDRSDVIKILDFGIARIVESATGHTTNLTQTGDVFGTPAYMSPEQCNGQIATSKSDIYSLGCVMYEVLAGRQPFQSTSQIQIALKHINEEPPDFDKNAKNVEEPRKSLEAIVMRCLAKEPSQRYENIEALLADLKHVQNGGIVKRLRFSMEPAPRSLVLSLLGYAAFVFLFGSMLFYVCVYNGIIFGTTQIRESLLTQVFALSFGTLAVIMSATAMADYKRFTAGKMSMYHFWELAETCAWAATGWSGLLLLGQHAMFLNSTTDLVFGSILGLLCAVSFISAFISALVASAIKHLKQWAKIPIQPFTKSTAQEHSAIAMGVAVVLFGIGAFAAPKMTAFVPYTFGSMFQIPAPQLSKAFMQGATALDPALASAYSAIAAINSRLENPPDELLSKLDAAIKSHPEADGLWTVRGEVYASANQLHPAVADFTKAIQLNLKNQRAIELRAKAYQDMGDYKKAEQDYGKLISLDPTSPTYYTKRAIVLAAMNSFDAAVLDLSKALIADNEGAEKNKDLLRVAIIYEYQGNRQKADEHYHLITQSGVDAEPAVTALAYKRLGQLNQYSVELEEAKRLAPPGRQSEEDIRRDLQHELFGNIPKPAVPW